MADIFEDEGHKFEALKLAFENQTQYLERFTQIDFRLFSGYVTLQLILGGWLFKNPVSNRDVFLQAGLFLIDLTMAIIAAVLLYKNHGRRREEIERLSRICCALEFTKIGTYVTGKKLYEDPVRSRPSLIWYMIAITVSLIGVTIMLFSGSNSDALVAPTTGG